MTNIFDKFVDKLFDEFFDDQVQDRSTFDLVFSRTDYKHAQLIVSIAHSEVFSAQLGLAVSGTGQ